MNEWILVQVWSGPGGDGRETEAETDLDRIQDLFPSDTLHLHSKEPSVAVSLPLPSSPHLSKSIHQPLHPSERACVCVEDERFTEETRWSGASPASGPVFIERRRRVPRTGTRSRSPDTGVPHGDPCSLHYGM